MVQVVASGDECFFRLSRIATNCYKAGLAALTGGLDDVSQISLWSGMHYISTFNKLFSQLPAYDAFIVAGTLERDVSADFVVITGTGLLKGDINCKFLFSAGTVHGNINACRYARFQSGSTVSGQIASPSLVVDNGVFMDCGISCDIGSPFWNSGKLAQLMLRLQARLLLRKLSKLAAANESRQGESGLASAG